MDNKFGVVRCKNASGGCALEFVIMFWFIREVDDNGRIEVGCALLQCLIRTKEYQREAMSFYPSSIRF
ncbi:hypothetical protein SDJN02_00843, partial [Cucurbita argyrosperma subsp. argyrosperma]